MSSAATDVREAPATQAASHVRGTATQGGTHVEGTGTQGAIRREMLLLFSVVALLAAACLPFARVYANGGFINPVAAAVLMPVGVAWACRRAGIRTMVTTAAGGAAWFVFSGAVFLPDTMRWAVVPTLRTMSAGLALVEQGVGFAQTRPSPVFPEPGLLLLTVAGVWGISLIVEGLVFRARSPLKAIVVAITLWAVPLTMAPASASLWPWAVPLLAASALLLLSFTGFDVLRWGTWVLPDNGQATGAVVHSPTGWFMAAGAIVVGSMFATSLPGFGDAPWFDVRGRAGTTLTANPIVQLRANLTARDTGPLFRVTTPQPVYLRSTALDVYDEQEQWTSSGIVGQPLDAGAPLPGAAIPDRDPFTVEVDVTGLDGAVLVPAPYDPVTTAGDLADRLQYDPASATFTLDTGETLDTGDSYTMLAAGRRADAERLASAGGVSGDAYTSLPENVPDEVGALAREIVAAAGARGQFAQALAIQEELRTWTYSLDPPQGHTSAAMSAFLQSRTGYCEQFAGTMAVMLRTLGIPARVATGFTPGQVQALDGPVTSDMLTDGVPDVYTVSWSNAHAWVEVLFPGGEWVAFEPTPRADGNVLVPTPGTVAPPTTVAQLAGTDLAMNTQNTDAVAPYDQYSDDFMRAQEGAVTGAAGASTGSRRPAAQRLGWLLAIAVLSALALLAVVAWRARTETRRATTPAERVLLARTRVGYLGRALGMRAEPWETDQEYLRRLAVGTDARAAADALADTAAQVRYAPSLDPDAAARAEGAEQALTRGLTGDRSRFHRSVLRMRGRLAIGWDGLRGLLTDWARVVRRPTAVLLRRSR